MVLQTPSIKRHADNRWSEVSSASPHKAHKPSPTLIFLRRRASRVGILSILALHIKGYTCSVSTCTM
ncbi:hypothetical protein Hanom_Chr13g01233521 [Helianthus anomalus]